VQYPHGDKTGTGGKRYKSRLAVRGEKVRWSQEVLGSSDKMKPQQLGAALKSLAESHATKRSFGDNDQRPVSELDFSATGGMVGLDKEGAQKVDDLAQQLILDRPKISEQCSKDVVRSEILESVKELVYSKAPLDPSGVASSLIKRLSGAPSKFIFVFPVKGGQLVSIIVLNRITLVPSLEMVSSAMTSRFPDDITTPSQDIDTMLRSNETPINAPPTKPDWFVISAASAMDEKKAEEIAFHIAEEDLGLLRFRMLGGSRNSVDTVSVELLDDPVLTHKKGQLLGSLRGALPSETFLLPVRIMGSVQEVLDLNAGSAESSFRSIVEILNNGHRSGMQERVYLGYTWLNKALKQKDTREQLLDAIIGMEALLLMPYESRGDTLAERMAFCLGKDLRSREEIFSQVKELMQTRNRVSHQGETKVVKQQADAACRALGRLTVVMAEKSQTVNEIGDLLREIQVMKFS